jgi:hypothetical protein
MSIERDGIKYQNPKDVIDDRLPDLKVGERYVETTTSSSLRDVFTGNLNYWHNFREQVTGFYKNPALQDAFQRCRHIGTSYDPDSLKKKWKHFAALEHTQIAEERDLQARFLNNVVDRVLATTRTLCEADYGSKEQLAVLGGFIPDDVNAGSAKVVPKDQRPHGEPDIVFKIPGGGSLQQVRVVGELKFFVTCDLSKHFDTTTGRVTAEQEGLQNKGSLRHMLGKFL